MNRFLPQSLFSINGQIGRAQFWVGSLLIAAVVSLATFAIEGSPAPEAYKFPGFMLLITAISIYLQTTLAANRLRDLQWPTWIAFPVIAIGNALGAASSLALIPANLETIAATIVLAGFAAEVIVCGFLPGKTSGNTNAIVAS